MIKLNLLPLKEKKQLNIKLYQDLATRFIIAFLWLSIIVFFLLFTFKYIIKNSLENMTEQNNAIIQSNKKLNSEIKKYNNELKSLSNMQDKNIVFSKIIIKITKIIPKEIILTDLSLQVDKEEKSNKTILIKMKGLAEKRDDLIKFKNNLNSLPYIKNIELPINTLLKQKNVDFEISTKLYLDKMK